MLWLLVVLIARSRHREAAGLDATPSPVYIPEGDVRRCAQPALLQPPAAASSASLHKIVVLGEEGKEPTNVPHLARLTA